MHIAQLGEQPALNRQVPGSKPGMRIRTVPCGVGTDCKSVIGRFDSGTVLEIIILRMCSQVVWQRAFNPYIAGSTPVTCTLVP